mmetsp:Transcript_21779/g.32281  ORF Transcript_21779/g.32281 Transcript_21779/m.32281 type:complete len:93 (-) Transcript_21779:1-279(-)
MKEFQSIKIQKNIFDEFRNWKSTTQKGVCGEREIFVYTLKWRNVLDKVCITQSNAVTIRDGKLHYNLDDSVLKLINGTEKLSPSINMIKLLC